MSVRPRRSFLTPFVVTLAAAPACFVQSATPPSQPVVQSDPGQPTESDPRPVQPPTQAPTIIANPPRPQVPPQPPASPPPDDRPVTSTRPPAPQLPGNDASWMVTKSSQGCRAQTMNTGGCPPNAMCNPPPPHAYACIEGEKYPVKVVRHGEVCQVETDPQPPCPRNAKCKPVPPPHVVPCPT
jgi:hypothetical protein